ncbi:hypothetical protein ACP70R_042524 [Stipagrostis hirtigluma subsp. patula]
MAGFGGKQMSDGPAAEAWPTRAEEPPRKKERRGRAAAVAVLILCLIMTLAFLVFVSSGRASASVAWQRAANKLTAMPGAVGFTDASNPNTTGASATTKPDVLLGGLLVPGFSRRSCRSRYQSPMYYKLSPYAPSSYLLKKLREYEARHEKCGPGTPLYAKSVEQLRSGRRSTEATDTECNYLVFLPFNGLGNRMLSLLSAFLYALLTGRVLLVQFPDDFADLFCEPFPDATWALPPDFPVEHLSWLGANSDRSYGNLVAQGKIVADAANATAAQSALPPYVYVHLANDHGDMDSRFYCNDDQLVLAKVSWLLLRADLYLVPSLYSIPEFHDELRRLFPAKESVSHLLGRYLLHPTNSVWGMVTRYYHTYLAQAEQMIGVQIRMFPFSTIPVDDMYNQILNCSRQENILPDIDDGDADTDTGSLGRASTKAILITSLYADYYERIKSSYYEHAAKGGAMVGVFQPSHEERQMMGQRKHHQKALAEMYLLSFSDVLLTSGMSTFGYVSSVLAGIRPTMLLTAHDHKVPATPCVRAVSMEPCLHKVPRVKCPGKDVDKEDLQRHVKACEDLRWGIKLFD